MIGSEKPNHWEVILALSTKVREGMSKDLLLEERKKLQAEDVD